MTLARELQSVGVGDCGCPEEIWIFGGLEIYIHFEPNGDVDAFADGGDWGEAETTIEGFAPDEGREAVFAWAASLLLPN